MTHGYRQRFLLFLSIALIGLVLTPNQSRSAQDDCQNCLSDCQEQRVLCVENGNPPAACLAAWHDCVDNCEENFCPLQ
jgi:hypothetical protein